jgi:hypothetical protein
MDDFAGVFIKILSRLAGPGPAYFACFSARRPLKRLAQEKQKARSCGPFEMNRKL